METVDFKKLPGEITSAANFFKDHLQGKIKTKGSQIQIDGVKHKDAKLLLHKFLRHRGLEGYRVISQSGFIEVAPPHLAKPSRQEGGTAPPAAATMPYFFPGSPPIPMEKRLKKKRES